MALFRDKNRILMVKVEAVSGTAEPLDPATDAVTGGDASFQNSSSSENLNEYTGSLDSASPIPTVDGGKDKCLVAMRSGGVAGQAPEFDALMQAAGFGVTVLAAAEADTAQAGGAAAITLAVGASGTDNAYAGRVIEITAGPGLGEKGLCIAYVGATKVATMAHNWTEEPTVASDYAVGAGVVYEPADTDLKTISWANVLRPKAAGDAFFEKLSGAVCNMSMTLETRKTGRINFDLTGQDLEAPDAADPGEPTLVDFNPEPMVLAEAYFDGAKIGLNSLSISTNAEITQGPDPSSSTGQGLAEITGRRIGGSMTLLRRAKATIDFLAKFKTGARGWVWVNWGSVAGRRVSVGVEVILTGAPSGSNVSGLTADNINHQMPPGGNFFVCFH